MRIARSLHLFFLSTIPACTIDKDPLETTTTSSSDGASESAEATSAPTTGSPTTGTSTGEPATATTIDIDTDDTGFATTIDIDTDDTGVATTTGDGPNESGLILFAEGEPMCMPVCVLDKEPRTTTLQPNCQVFAVDVDAQTQQELVPCIEVMFEWAIPAGEVRCYAEQIDRDNETPLKTDQMSETCLATGFNLEFMVVASEPTPPGVVFGANCELSFHPEWDCPDA